MQPFQDLHLALHHILILPFRGRQDAEEKFPEILYALLPHPS